MTTEVLLERLLLEEEEDDDLLLYYMLRRRQRRSMSSIFNTRREEGRVSRKKKSHQDEIQEASQSPEAGPSSTYPSTSTFPIKEDDIIKEEHIEESDLPDYIETSSYLPEVDENVNTTITESQDNFRTDNQSSSNASINNFITSPESNQTMQIRNEEESSLHVPYTKEYINAIYEIYQQAVNETQYTQTTYELLELCVICAKDISKTRSKKSVKKFLDIILTVTLVDVSRYPVELNCCCTCYSSLLQIKRFQKTVVEAGMLIHKKLGHFVKEYRKDRPHTALYFNTNESTSSINNQPIETEVVVQTIEVVPIKFEPKNLEEEIYSNSNQVEAVLHSNQTNLQSGIAIKIEEVEQDINIPDNYEIPNLPSEKKRIDSIEKGNSKDEANKIYSLNENNSFMLIHHQLRSSNIVQEDGRIRIKCPICQKLYVRNYYKKHLLIHNISKKSSENNKNGERQHTCKVCGQSFYSLNRLKHQLRSHTDEKLFKCTYCNKTFSISWKLRKHLRLHTNSQPYKCKLCSAAFRHNVTLKGHLRSAHSASEIAAVNTYGEGSAVDSEQATVEEMYYDNSANTLESELNENVNTENQ